MQWKTIDWINPNYSISDDGQVINNRNGRVLKCETHYKGYHRITLNKKHHMIHRLVALAFIPNPQNKPHINHLDGNKLNNHYSNLEWCTAAENNKHAIDTGLCGANKQFLSEEEAKQIKYLNSNLSCRILAELYKVHQSTIWDCRNGRSWKDL